MQQISIVLNEVKGHFDNITVDIHASKNLYDIALVCYVLLDAEARQVDMLFDSSLSANVIVNQSSTTINHQDIGNSMSKNF